MNEEINIPRGTDVTDMRRTYSTRTGEEFPETLIFELQKEDDLRYGENPNQPGAVYRFVGTRLPELLDITLVKSGKGGLSGTNIMDVTRALEILKFFDDPSVAVMKHVIPSGFATQYRGNSLDDIYVNARDADARSAFGSIVVLNRPLDKATAEAIMSSYVEAVVTPDFEQGTMDILSERGNLRVLRYSGLENLPKFVGDDIEGFYDVKVLPSGRLVVQRPYLSSIRGPDDLITDPLVRDQGKDYLVKRDPTQEEMDDLLTAWYVNVGGVRSNGIIFVRNGTTLAVGSGQQERVGAVEQAIRKSYQKAMDREGIEYDPLDLASSRHLLSGDLLEGSVMSSDAFFPFRDSIDTIGRVGVTAVIQPGGSLRDYEVIEAVNENNMAMAYTLERCFSHH